MVVVSSNLEIQKSFHGNMKRIADNDALGVFGFGLAVDLTLDELLHHLSVPDLEDPSFALDVDIYVGFAPQEHGKKEKRLKVYQPRELASVTATQPNVAYLNSKISLFKKKVNIILDVAECFIEGKSEEVLEKLEQRLAEQALPSYLDQMQKRLLENGVPDMLYFYIDVKPPVPGPYTHVSR